MSSLTKKSLYFMVLFIVCNPTFSADNPGFSNNEHDAAEAAAAAAEAEAAAKTAQCKTNVNLVFFEGNHPYFSFMLAMFALSIDTINAMTTTAQLSTDIITQYRIFMRDAPTNEEQMEMSDAFAPVEYGNIEIMGNWIGSRNIEFSELGIKYILDYFQFLVYKFKTLKNPIQINIKSPELFCQKLYAGNQSNCQKALAISIRHPVDRLNKLKAYRSCKASYQYHNYFDFTNNSIFQKLDSSKIEIPNDETYKNHLTRIMKTYFRYLMKKINQIALAQLKNNDPNLFPTVDYYCTGPGQFVA